MINVGPAYVMYIDISKYSLFTVHLVNSNICSIKGSAAIPMLVNFTLKPLLVGIPTTQTAKNWTETKKLCNLKGSVTQNIFSLKNGPNGCIDLGNDIDLQKKWKQI